MPLTDADREAIRACQPAPKGESTQVYVKDPYRKGYTSYAMGCHADQVPEFNKALEAHGLQNRAHYTPDGRFFADSKEARKQAMKAFGYFDRAAYY